MKTNSIQDSAAICLSRSSTFFLHNIEGRAQNCSGDPTTARSYPYVFNFLTICRFTMVRQSCPFCMYFLSTNLPIIFLHIIVRKSFNAFSAPLSSIIGRAELPPKTCELISVIRPELSHTTKPISSDSLRLHRP